MKTLLSTALMATALIGGTLAARAADPIVIEAEDYTYGPGMQDVTPGEGSMASGIMIGGTSGASGDYDQTLAGDAGNYATYLIANVAEAGTYDLTIYYNSMNDRWIEVTINNQPGHIVYCDETTQSWDGTTVTREEENGTVTYPGIVSKTIKVYLEKGDNEMRVESCFGYSKNEGRDIPYLPNLDRYEFVRSATEIEKPAEWYRYQTIFREMESFDGRSGSGNSDERAGFHGGKAASVGASGGTLVYNVNVETAGVYNMTVWYCLWGNRWAKFKVNEGEPYLVQFNMWVNGTDWNVTDEHRNFLVYLEKGDNTITVSNYTKTGTNASENGDTPPMDCFTLDLVSYPDFVIPANEIAAPKYALSNVASWSSNELDVAKIKDHTEWTIAQGSSNTASVVLEFPYNILPTGFKWASENADKDSWTVDVSTDGSNWKSTSSSASVNTVGRFTTVTLPNPFTAPDPVKYVRLNISGSANAQIGDFAVFGYPYASAECHNPAGVISTDGTVGYMTDLEGFYLEETDDDGNLKISDETARNLFDGNNSTFWTPVNTNSDYWESKSELNVEVYLDDVVKLSSYLIATPYRENWASRNPKSWTLKAYDENYVLGDDDDEYAAFKTIDSQEEFDWNGIGNAYILPVNQDFESYYYMFSLTNAKNATWHLSGLQLYTENHSGDSGVTETEVNPALVFAVVPGGIQFVAEEGTAYDIYSINGMTVAKGNASANGNNVALSQGLYIVKIGKIVKKVSIR